MEFKLDLDAIDLEPSAPEQSVALSETDKSNTSILSIENLELQLSNNSLSCRFPRASYFSDLIAAILRARGTALGPD